MPTTFILFIFSQTVVGTLVRLEPDIRSVSVTYYIFFGTLREEFQEEKHISPNQIIHLFFKGFGLFYLAKRRTQTMKLQSRAVCYNFGFCLRTLKYIKYFYFNNIFNIYFALKNI